MKMKKMKKVKIMKVNLRMSIIFQVKGQIRKAVDIPQKINRQKI